MKIILFVLVILINLNLHAQTGEVTGLEIPRFVSLKSDDINLRVGPSVNYPILIKFVKKDLPIEIIDEFDTWRKIRDRDNNIGWIHKSLLKGERFVLNAKTTNNDLLIFNKPNGKNIGLIKNNNILRLTKCLKLWCHITHLKLSGWVQKKDIWGVYKNEIYNINFMQFFINQYWRFSETKLSKILKIN